MNKQLMEKIRQAIDKLSLQKKIALAGITAAALFGFILLLVWANRPEYGLLYSNLDEADAAKIVDDLKSNNISYKLKDGGRTILVPQKNIYELRLKYASQKLISSGAVGYELFDKNNLGLTDFMQKVNLKRALEGELTKTINQIEAIQQSRVHLVIPEPRLFEEEEAKATASVVVKLKPNTSLTTKQILGITHLVAGSVEGLTPENVTIVDTYGNILTNITASDEGVQLSNTQFELKQKVEKYLAQKAQSMLEQVLGKGNAIVKVSATLNFKKIKRKSEIYDPDNTVVLSEERNQEKSSKPDTTLYERQNVITNYEINKTIEEFEGSVGDIERLSVAVFVNSSSNQVVTAGNSGQNNAQLSDQELKKIEEIVKSAVGFNPARKDEIEVQQIPFDRSFIDQERKAIETIENREFILELVRTGLVVVAALVLLFLSRSILRRMGVYPIVDSPKALPVSEESKNLYIEPEAIKEIDIPDDIYAKKLSPEAVARLKTREKIMKEVTGYAENEPEQTMRLLRYWLIEG